MNGIWSSGCVEANNDMILNESLTFDEIDLRIEIKGHKNLECNGNYIFRETISISFEVSGTTSVSFNNEQVLVNKTDGTARYSDGSKESFKQVFMIDENGRDDYVQHAIFENDGDIVDGE